jgi:hypothetical protein
VRQIQKTPDVDAILLDGIDTSVEWRVESERPILESMPDWIQQEVGGAVAEEEEAGGRGGMLQSRCCRPNTHLLA